MAKLFKLAVFVVAALLSSSLTAADKKAEIELSRDPKSIVITLDYEGGFRADPKVTLGEDGRAIVEEIKPALQIQADGTVLKSGKVVKKLSVGELEKLLAFIVVDNKFFEFDKATVQATVKEKQAAFDKLQREKSKPGGVIAVRMLPEDMGTPTVTVELGDRKKTIGYYGVTMVADWYPDIKPLQQLKRINQELQSL